MIPALPGAPAVDAWRVCRAAHPALDGEGARLYGGRWNSAGRALVYASRTLALAALEVLAHVDLETAPDDLVAIGLRLPAAARVDVVDPGSLPAGWREPEAPACAKRGDAWLATADRALALLVPSAIVPVEANLLLDPTHPQMAGVVTVVTEPFAFDPRLW